MTVNAKVSHRFNFKKIDAIIPDKVHHEIFAKIECANSELHFANINDIKLRFFVFTLFTEGIFIPFYIMFFFLMKLYMGNYVSNIFNQFSISFGIHP